MKKNISQYNNFKFTIESGKEGKITIRALDSAVLEMFQSQPIELQKISINTINAAFKGQASQIKYIVYREEDALSLEIAVQLDYLPKISEIICLGRVRQAEAQQKYLFSQIKQEVDQLENDLLSVNKPNVMLFDINNVQVQSEPIWRANVARGRYLLEFSGYILQEYGYNDMECEEWDSQAILYSKNGIKLAFGVYEGEENKLVEEKVFELCILTQSEYEIPFNITFIAHLRTNGVIVAKQHEVSNQHCHITSSILTLTTLN